jgi:hypothetical protein
MSEKSSVFASELPRKEHHADLRKSVCKAIDEMKDGTRFTAMELRRLAGRYCPKAETAFLETILRYMRYYRRMNVICISRSKALYEKVTFDKEN